MHAENVLDVQLGVFAVAGHLDAAALAAASGVNLRLDDDAGGALGKQFAGHRRGFFRRVGHFAPGHGDAVFRQDFLCLILVNFQVYIQTIGNPHEQKGFPIRRVSNCHQTRKQNKPLSFMNTKASGKVRRAVTIKICGIRFFHLLPCS